MLELIGHIIRMRSQVYPPLAALKAARVYGLPFRVTCFHRSVQVQEIPLQPPGFNI